MSTETTVKSDDKNLVVDNLLFDTEQDIVKLNVGGTKFATRAETLKKAKSHYFDRLVEAACKRPNHEWFVDRSPELFALLLNVLRTETVSTPVANYRALYEEIQFFGIDRALNGIGDICDFLYNHAELMSIEHNSHFVPWDIAVTLQKVPTTFLLPPPCLIKLSSDSLNQWGTDSTILAHIRVIIMHHAEAYLTNAKPINERYSLKHELEFLKQVGLTDDECYYSLAYQLYRHNSIPTKRIKLQQYGIPELQELLNNRGNQDPHCLGTLVSTISNAFVYRFANTPLTVIFIHNYCNSIQIIIEKPTQFAFYMCGRYRAMKEYSKTAAPNLQLPNNDDIYFDVWGDYCTIGTYAKDCYPKMHFICDTDSNQPNYKQACIYTTPDEPHIGDKTSLLVYGVCVVSFVNE